MGARPNEDIIHERAADCNAYFRQIAKSRKSPGGHLFSCAKHTNFNALILAGFTKPVFQ